MRWFDAHLDLACLAVNGREMLASPEEGNGPWLPAAVTLRSLAEGGVGHALATIFTEAGGDDARISYPVGDAAAAHRAGLLQLEVYRAWQREGHASGMEDGTSGGLRMGILIEGADPITAPDELAWWADQGVVAVGLSWWKHSRYAAGNGSVDPRAGLTDPGRALVREIDRLGLVHDASHLADRSFDELRGMVRGRVMASHSNCRALLGDPHNQRHLTDEQITWITGRGGVIGLNLYSKFLRPHCGETDRATIDQCVAHVEHVCGIASDRRHVGLGSDMDGGFSAARLPEGINLPRDMEKLTDALSARGWSDADIQGFAFGNWARFLCLKPLSSSC